MSAPRTVTCHSLCVCVCGSARAVSKCLYTICQIVKKRCRNLWKPGHHMLLFPRRRPRFVTCSGVKMKLDWQVIYVCVWVCVSLHLDHLRPGKVCVCVCVTSSLSRQHLGDYIAAAVARLGRRSVASISRSWSDMFSISRKQDLNNTAH